MMTEAILSLSCLMHVCLAGMLHAPAVPAAPDWKTVAAAGRVEARQDTTAEEAWSPLRRGTRVAPLSHVRTFERARATLTRQGDLILIDAASEVVLPDEIEGGNTVVLQKTGNAIYRVAPRDAGRRFEVRTPYLVAGVKGTRFSVQIFQDHAAVSVLEGIVEVRSLLTGDAEDLTAGQLAIVERNEGRMELHREQAPPAAASSASEVFELREKSRRLDAELRKAQNLAERVELGLWADLSNNPKNVTRATAINDPTRTTTCLDPTEQDVKTDTTLIDAVPLPVRKGN